MTKQAEKLRHLTPEELGLQERDQMDQLFRLKFQLKMGQAESLSKIRALRRQVARIKTLRRQHDLGIVPQAAAKRTARPKAAAAPAPVKAAKASSKTAPRKTAARKAGKE